jgi:hypothetical protein
LDALGPVVPLGLVPAGAAFARERFVLASASSIVWIWLSVKWLDASDSGSNVQSWIGLSTTRPWAAVIVPLSTSCVTVVHLGLLSIGPPRRRRFGPGQRPAGS